MKLFNYKYFFQNIKKSASVLALFIGIIPILNVIIFLLLVSGSPNGFLATLSNLSILLFIGMYIIPLILAYTLYNFMFKRKSIDFIGSMPISKKSIYLTNTLGGSLLLSVMLLLTISLIGLTSLLLPNVYLTFPLLFDLFVIFLVGYLFMYSIITLAFSVVGNFITGLAVALLLLFLLPYFQIYKNSIVYSGYYSNDAYIVCHDEACIPDNYTCYEYDYSCLEHQRKNEYRFYLYESANTNIPIFSIAPLFAFFGVEGVKWVAFDKGQLFTTGLLTLFYFTIGYFIYKRRKLEHCETSFYHFSVHLIVKGLTMFPICTILYEMVREQSFYANLFALALLLIYYFVYDLITRKHIEKIKVSFLAFGIALFTSLGICFFIHQLPKETVTYFASEDISSIQIKKYREEMYQTETYMVKDKNTIHQILSYLVQDDSNHTYNVDITLSSKGREYKTNILLTEEQYSTLFEKLEASKIVSQESIEGAYALSIYHNFVTQDFSWYKDKVSAFLTSGKKQSGTCLVDTGLTFYRYHHHEVESVRISSCISEELQKKIIQDNNQKISEWYNKNRGHFNSISILNEELEGMEDFDFLESRYAMRIHQYIYEAIQKPILLKEDMLIFSIVGEQNSSARAYMNDKDAFVSFIETLREEAKNTQEYQEYKEQLEEKVRGEDT